MPSVLPRSLSTKEQRNGEESGISRSHLFLNVYDLTPINNYLYWFGLGIFHTGIEVHGMEYGFGAHDYATSGVFEVEPKSCPGFVFRRSLWLGATDMSRAEFRMFIEQLSGKYYGDTYHLIAKNCNHFTDDVCMRLTGKSIPGWVLSATAFYLKIFKSQLSDIYQIIQHYPANGGSGRSGRKESAVRKERCSAKTGAEGGAAPWRRRSAEMGAEESRFCGPVQLRECAMEELGQSNDGGLHNNILSAIEEWRNDLLKIIGWLFSTSGRLRGTKKTGRGKVTDFWFCKEEGRGDVTKTATSTTRHTSRGSAFIEGHRRLIVVRRNVSVRRLVEVQQRRKKLLEKKRSNSKIPRPRTRNPVSQKLAKDSVLVWDLRL
ncbi:DeSI-like protein [Platanthera guangdongensis]|uniref:DeSI-like protein n=1 Tax=Platanthera guangdongensis TaxID=2320717 RepID=A0ABR2LM09_9ASPA